MDYNRRKFLKSAGALATTAMLPMQFSMRNAHAVETTGNKKLVVLKLHGGNDGLNLAIPTQGYNPLDGSVTPGSQYDLYQGYRPNIHIPGANLLPVGTDNGGMEFGLHPSMAALMPNFDKLAIFPATHSSVGTYAANRSHFYQMDLYGAGMTGLNPISPDGKGWIGRYYDNRYPSIADGLVGQDFTDGTHGTMRGDTFLLQLSNPSNVSLGTSTQMGDDIWNDIKGLSNPDPAGFGGRYKSKQVTLFDEILDRLRTEVDFGRTANATYPGGLGTNFKRTADMLLDLPELEVVHLSLGGFDTHQNQITNGGGTYDPLTGQQANLFDSIASSIAAFYDDLSAVDPALRSNVVVTVQTEFGRTIRENGNYGTDHGNASCWLAFGDSVAGGVYGTYPGLEPENLNGGNWLQPTIDYRDIFTEVIGGHLGYASANSSFPGYTGPTTGSQSDGSLGFLA